MIEEWPGKPTRKLDVTLKALEKQTVDGIECTWVELVVETVDKRARRGFRFLAPDQKLRMGDDPLGSAKEVWVRDLNEKPRLDPNWGGYLPRLMLVCPPPNDRPDASEESKQDVVDARATEQTTVIEKGKHRFYGGAITIDTTFQFNKSDAAPFGTARATVAVTERKNCDPDNPKAVCEITTGKVEFTMTVSGRDAEPFVDIVDAQDDEPRRGPKDGSRRF
ncbi:hypothetical protein CGZ80_11120 [Rhodopirellula sp. MGV]|nr:hypothetical protein CGZ80_11120 [Rhodopirellula sp. MGV]PNY34043.1 hypothetical protein C2E31_25420 [Rhodopirellula baltica]PNY35652.1 hypothetical protein C2E31_17095 [Rhodopirellula baltica]